MEARPHVAACLLLKFAVLHVLLAQRTCAKGWFRCKYVFDCIPMSSFQDGVTDCYDKSDEERQGIKCIRLNIGYHLSFYSLIFDIYR